MYRLTLRTSASSAVTEAVPLTCTPGGLVVGISYTPRCGDGRRVSETLDLTLEGSESEIEGYIEAANRLLAQARREAEIPGGEWVYLVCQNELGGDEWESQVLGGQLGPGEAGIDQRLSGLEWRRLTLERVDWWEKSAEELLLKKTLNTSDGANQWVGLYSHTDAEHGNILDVPRFWGERTNITGDLPAPALLGLHLPGDPGGEPYTFIVGETARAEADLLAAVYQGEDGAARGGAAAQIVADAGCSGGSCLSLTWSGTDYREVWGVDLDAEDVRRMGGHPFRPVLRLKDGVPAPLLWYCWHIYTLRGADEYLLHESQGQYMETDQELILGPTVYLPPWLVNPRQSGPAPALRLVLAVQSAGIGSHTLKLDFLQLLGLDGWRIYRPLCAGPAQGIFDDGRRGVVSAVWEAHPAHTWEGPGFTLFPGRDHRFTILALRPAASGLKTVPLDQLIQANITYHRRRRSL